MRIIILTKKKEDGLNLLSSITNICSPTREIRCYTKEDIINNVPLFEKVETIFSTWYMPSFSEEEIKVFFPSLKAVFYAAGTVKYFAEPFLKAGIRVFSSAKANGIPVAEFVTAQILLANKGYFQAQKANKSFLWRWAFRKAKSYTDNRKGNYGAKVGLIGCGSVGREVVRLLKPYHIEVYIHDPYISDEQCKSLGVRNISLKDLFETCDVISNHLLLLCNCMVWHQSPDVLSVVFCYFRRPVPAIRWGTGRRRHSFCDIGQNTRCHQCQHCSQADCSPRM